MPERESALKNRNRKMLLGYIKNHPGVTFRSLKEMYDLTDGNLRYHLGFLEKNRDITSKFKGGKKVYFPKGMSASGLEHPGMGNINRDQKRIVKVVRQDPGITKKEISRMLKMSRRKLDTNLRKLLDKGLVRGFVDDGVTGYEYVSKRDIRKEVFKLLVIKLIREEIDEETFNILREELDNEG